MSHLRRFGGIALSLSITALFLVWGIASGQTVDTTPDPDDISFSFLLTAAGAGVAAGIVTTFVQLLKRAIAQERLTGALLAFIVSAILYLLAGISIGVDSLDEGLVVFVAWLTCATAAVGVYEVAVNKGLTA